jgi:hypothetical protein
LATEDTKTRMVQMKRIEIYLELKSAMMTHLSFAVENQSMQDSLYHLLEYHLYKDIIQKVYFLMSHEEREILHGLLIL